MKIFLHFLIIFGIGTIILAGFGIVTNEQINIYISAFFGAFFSFFITRISIRIDQIIDRKKIHLRKIQHIQKYLITNLTSLQLNLETTSKYVESLKERRRISPFLKNIEVNYSLLEDIRNLTLLNTFAETLNIIDQLNYFTALAVNKYNSIYQSIQFRLQSVPSESIDNIYSKEVAELAIFLIEDFHQLIDRMTDAEKSMINSIAHANVIMQNSFQKSYFDNFVSLISNHEEKLPSNFNSLAACRTPHSFEIRIV